MTPASPPNLKFLMEPMSILANLGLNLVWFTSISKLTDGPHPDYDQGCRLGELLREGEGGGPLGGEGPPWSSHLGPRGLFLLGTLGTTQPRGTSPPVVARSVAQTEPNTAWIRPGNAIIQIDH